jgi:hypothetical protein
MLLPEGRRVRVGVNGILVIVERGINDIWHSRHALSLKLSDFEKTAAIWRRLIAELKKRGCDSGVTE